VTGLSPFNSKLLRTFLEVSGFSLDPETGLHAQISLWAHRTQSNTDTTHYALIDVA